MSKSVFADNHDTTKTLDGEEPLPLNDPFAGDDASASTIISDSSEVETRNLSKFKLVGVFMSKRDQFATLVDDTGEFISLELFEELTEGLRLVDVNMKQAVFEKNEDNKFLIINFKNQIMEVDEY